MCKFLYISMTYSLQHEVFLASCYLAIHFVNVCSNGKLNKTNLWRCTEKLAFECDKSFSGVTTNLHQQNPCMTSGIRFPNCI